MSDLRPAPLYNDVAEGPEGGEAWWLTCSDGVQIRVAHWPCKGARGTVILMPGRTEYIEKYGRSAADLAARGYGTVSIDWRGQGLADRLIKDRDSGYVGRFMDYQLDVAAMMAALSEKAVPGPYFLIAHSMGGAIGLRALMGGLPVKAVTFSAPMWGILMSSVMKPAAWTVSTVSRYTGLGKSYAPGTRAKTYVLDEPFDGNTLTTDKDMWNYMVDHARSYPDLVLGGPSMHWLNEALKELIRLKRADSPDIPALTYLGDQEQIVDPVAIHDRMGRWPNGELRLIEGAEHEVLMEVPTTRNAIFDETAAFFDRHL